MSEQTKSPNEIATELLEGLEGVTPGEWLSDAIKSENDSGNFNTYAVYSENGVVSDALNNEVSEIIFETDDFDGGYSTDIQAKADIEHIARCSKPNIEALATSHKRLVEAVSDLLDQHDSENPGAAMEPVYTCSQCTLGTTPKRIDKGPCAYHRTLTALAIAKGDKS